MSKLKLKAQLTSIGAVNNSYLYLERLPTIDYPFAMAIGLYPKNSAKKEWNNNNISIEVVGDLEIQVNIHAFRGTDWTFKLINKANSKELLNISGKTGSKPEDGLNISIIKDSITL